MPTWWGSTSERSPGFEAQFDLRKDAFIKGSFTRVNGPGRVTELCARPLLRVLYPELAKLVEPLGGVIGGPVQAFKRFSKYWPNDYGFDVSVLIQAFLAGVPIKEYAIGELNHAQQSLEKLARMAEQVTAAILDTPISPFNPGEFLDESRFLEGSPHAHKPIGAGFVRTRYEMAKWPEIEPERAGRSSKEHGGTLRTPRNGQGD